MLDSTTYEEANGSIRNWIRQRSRWIKGYLQTLLVHTRGGWDLRRTRDLNFLTFLLIVGAKALVNFINPLMWALTLSYFVLRDAVGKSIESLYPAPVFYIAVVTLVFGNLLFVYTFLLGSARRGNHDLIKYGLLAPLYWLMMSLAAVKALGQLIGKPHYWEKTIHGLHLAAASPGRPPAGSAVPIPARHDQRPDVRIPRQRDRLGRHRLEELDRAADAAEQARWVPSAGQLRAGSRPGPRSGRYDGE
jgi:hypothetical protein